MLNERKIKVMVIGCTGTGKTTVSYLIQQALQEAGISVEYVDMDNEKSFQHQKERLNVLKNDLKIKIYEKQANIHTCVK